MLFNKTLAKRAAKCENVTGSMGRTTHVASIFLPNGTMIALSTGSKSNYAYVEPTYGNPATNKTALKAAPVGAVYEEYFESNWSGNDPEAGLWRAKKVTGGYWVAC